MIKEEEQQLNKKYKLKEATMLSLFFFFHKYIKN